jgi:tetratricopeptide (TPR) repeat protein
MADATTKEDYNLYLKSGDRNPKWDDLIKPAFQSFDDGNLATAGIFLKQAYDRGCRDPFVLFRLGLYRESRGLFKEAAEMLAIAADDAPKRYPGHPLATAIARHAGRALYEADDLHRAGPLVERALTQTPNDFMLLLMAGQIARLEKRTDDARNFFERALSVPPPPVGPGLPDPRTTILRELVILTCDTKDVEGCERYITLLLNLAPRDSVAQGYRQRILRERQQKKEQELIEKMVK